RIDTAKAVPNDDDPSASLATGFTQDFFQSRQGVIRAIHVAPNAGEKGPVAVFAESIAERA
ncbi:MAG: hypothetical protein WCC76_12255, partial [Candidatus Acidiferrales bacterium]